MVSPGLPPRRWPFVVLAVVAVAGVYVSYAGRVMAGMFTMSNLAQLAHWRRVAYIYLSLLGLAVVLLVFAGVALWRRRARSDQSAAL